MNAPAQGMTMAESKIAGGVHARVAAMIAEAGGDSPEAAPTEAAETASAPESPAGAPPTGGDSGAESVPVETPPAAEPKPDDAVETQKAKHELLREKLAKLRAENDARESARRAREYEERAKTDAEAAAAEKAKYAGLRNGTFLETVKALGLDPRQTFEEMKDEALKAGTPEAQLQRMQQQFDAQIAEAKAKIEKLEKEREEERQKREATERQARFDYEFKRDIADEALRDLRIEYDDEQLADMAWALAHDRARMLSHAKRLNVQLTRSDGRYSMKEILTVLSRAHAEHEDSKKQRRERLQATIPSQAAPQQAPANAKTVNGTAEKRNAGNPLGNEAATSRSPDPKSTEKRRYSDEERRQRVQRLVDRS